MSIVAIRSNLETRLKTWADSKSPVLPVSFEGMTFEKPSDYSPWIECFLIPSGTFNRDISVNHSTQVGVFQINVWIKAGIGTGLAGSIADEICSLFVPGVSVSGLNIESTPFIGSAIEPTTGWTVLPVRVLYRQEN